MFRYRSLFAEFSSIPALEAVSYLRIPNTNAHYRMLPAPQAKISLVALAAISSFGLAFLAPTQAANKAVYDTFKADIDPILDSYCYDCHGFGTNKGGVTLDEFTAENIGDHELWMRVLRNSRAHIMPPLEEYQPSDEERAQLLDWIKSGPFGVDPSNPDPGKLTVQRLNRIEYQNTIRDLIGVDFNAEDAFPADDSGEGFDNLGDILSISPMLLEKYLDAANKIISEAVPTQSSILPEQILTGKRLVDLFSPAQIEDDADDDNLQLSFYEASERHATYEIEKAGAYQVVVRLAPKSFSSFNGFDYNRCKLTFAIDGETKIEREFEFTNGATIEYVFDYDWKPGDKSFSVAVEPLTSGLEKIKRLKMRVERLSIRGPMDREHWIKPKDYDRFFPGGIPEDAKPRRAYTAKLLGDFAKRAYRRPVEDKTIAQLVDLAEGIAAQKGFNHEMGISQAMIAILASPRFIFREEGYLPSKSKNEHPLIDEYALASRLSYFFWSSMPDAELFELASKGELRAQLDAQIERMMGDPKSDAFVKNFAGQWLHARDIRSVNISSFDVFLRDHPDPELSAARKAYTAVREIPDYLRTPEQQETYTRTRAIIRSAYRIKRPELKRPLQEAMRNETEMFFEHIIRENRPLRELLDSDYTFLNQALAEHYGIEDVKGPRMRKVDLEPNSPRGGVLTQGTLLAFTSNPTRTSPVKRGVFILENILGTPPAPPPPNIPSLEDLADEGEFANMSLRETLALHREDPLCSSCHNRMDPLGLALENFNAMGIWRESELNQPIEPHGMLITGEKFDTIQEMKRILANERIRDFYYCFSEKLMTYALGRGMEYYDTATLDKLVDTLFETDGSPTALIHAMVDSAPFQKRRHPNFNPN